MSAIARLSQLRSLGRCRCAAKRIIGHSRGMDRSGAEGGALRAEHPSGRHDHDHDPHGHGHGHGHEHGHEHRAGLVDRIVHVVQPHSHEAADKIDTAMQASAAGMRALWISLTILVATAAIQAGWVVISGPVAPLGQTLHNAADALTAVPLTVAFLAGRRAPTRRHTYGY